MRLIVILLVSAAAVFSSFAGDAAPPAAPPPTVLDSVVPAVIEIQKKPLKVKLTWPADARAIGFAAQRKLPGEKEWSKPKKLEGSATSYEDSDVEAGKIYEYAVVRLYRQKVKARVKNKEGKEVEQEFMVNIHGFAFLCAALEAPLVESRGGLLLLVDKTQAGPLKAELLRLEQDLAGDGWQVIRREVERTATVPEIKAAIKKACEDKSANIKALFLFGHIAVPYSGNIYPDGHEDHQGAWPADVYYGDLDGEWTDTTVNNAKASRAENKNIPGDGKFDQSVAPSPLELQVGRVDLSNMPAFKKNETELLRQYLDRDHAYRHKEFEAPRRGLIDDNFGTYGGVNFAANGWGNFGALVGRGNVSAQDWFTVLPKETYQWAYGCGAGGYHSCSGVGDINSFVSTESKAVFTMLYGSFFGDWDVQNCFLRGPLAAAGTGLTATWTGAPHWFFHHMGIGEPIGYSVWVNHNNRGQQYPILGYQNPPCLALMGDPTLRLNPIAPPKNLTALRKKEKTTLRWEAPAEEVAGYHVYRAANAQGPFKRVNEKLLTKLEFKDDDAGKTDQIYMVRAVKLQKTPSGTYFDAS